MPQGRLLTSKVLLGMLSSQGFPPYSLCMTLYATFRVIAEDGAYSSQAAALTQHACREREFLQRHACAAAQQSEAHHACIRETNIALGLRLGSPT